MLTDSSVQTEQAAQEFLAAQAECQRLNALVKEAETKKKDAAKVLKATLNEGDTVTAWGNIYEFSIKRSNRPSWKSAFLAAYSIFSDSERSVMDRAKETNINIVESVDLKLTVPSL